MSSMSPSSPRYLREIERESGRERQREGVAYRADSKQCPEWRRVRMRERERVRVRERERERGERRIDGWIDKRIGEIEEEREGQTELSSMTPRSPRYLCDRVREQQEETDREIRRRGG